MYIVVEGHTEREVVNGILKPHFSPMGVYLFTVLVKTAPGYHGGGNLWSKWEKDIRRLLKQHKRSNVRVTTMFDLFRLPNGFPGIQEHGLITDTAERCHALERAMAEVFDDLRFIPYLQRHEIEALVLASLDYLGELFDAPDDRRGVQMLKEEIGDLPPEEVNDSPETAPSRRLERHIPGYRKALHGPLAIEAAGLQHVREKCPRFDQWVKKLERLAEEGEW